jgi:ABC-type nickel/cobalt efflux system permease component RcnA
MRFRFHLFSLCALCASVVNSSSAQAHPVLPETHDRIIVVQVTPGPRAENVDVRVSYCLQVSEGTALVDDLAPLKDEIDLSRYQDQREAYYVEFTRLYAPILAKNLIVTVDGETLPLKCDRSSFALRDDQGQVLGHLRCDFHFHATFVTRPGQQRELQFREGNYVMQEGQIDLSLAPDGSLQVDQLVQPDAALKARAGIRLKDGDEERLRQASLRFATSAGEAASAAPEGRIPSPSNRGSGEPSLLYYFLSSEHTLPVLIVLFVFFGALHALTPGHGKTLVAAYLVGERGTMVHALFLGLMTTLTHTGAVFAVGLVLLAFFPRGMSRDTRQDLQTGLELAGGMLVLLLGAWLLLRRLGGKADHFHVGGHGHHHHHDHGHTHEHHDHVHDADGHVHPVAGDRNVSWWALTILGISGGIVPCWDAIVILVVGLSADLLGRAMILLLAFSAGLASVLIALGIAVVYTKGFAASRWGSSRVFKALPILSAALVTALGFWLCYDSIHSRAAESPPRQTAVAPRP